MRCTAIKGILSGAVRPIDLKMFTPEKNLNAALRTHVHGECAARVLASAFNAVDAGVAVKKYLHENPLPKARRIFSFGLGKAACAMTSALADETSLTRSLVITKHASPLNVEPVTVIEGDHPVPGSASLAAGKAVVGVR